MSLGLRASVGMSFEKTWLNALKNLVKLGRKPSFRP